MNDLPINDTTGLASYKPAPIAATFCQRRPLCGGRAMRSLINLGIASCSLLVLGCERWELDRKMEELCKQDGGIRVYETVTLPASEFGSTSQPLEQYMLIAKSSEDYLGPDYKNVWKTEILIGQHADATKGEGQLQRLHSLIYRRSDGRLLGEQIRYNRSGGDEFTFGFQPSGKSCPHFERGLAQSIFIKEE